MNRLLTVACIAVLTGCAASGGTGRFTGSSGTEPSIRVLLAKDGESYRIEATGGVAVKSSEGVRIIESAGGGVVRVGIDRSSLQIDIQPGGATAAVEGSVVIEPVSKSTLVFDGTPYAGTIHAVAMDDGAIAILNVLPVEKYLESVVPHEMGDPGAEGYDALKSQAIAARTYALGKIDSHKGELFDVHASVLDQVYGGLNGTSQVASAAVRDTRGRVIDYGGSTIRAYYSACCGGHTSDIRVVWPDREPANYLYGIPDHTVRDERAFCRDYKRFRWRYNFTGLEMGAILRITIAKELGISADDVGMLKDMRVDAVSHSGRVARLTIDTTTNTFVFEGDRIRWILQTDPSRGIILPSVMFHLDKTMERDRIAFVSISGGGNGHGVGMCQTGSIAMAKKGYTYEMILAHYYPGSRVEKMY